MMNIEPSNSAQFICFTIYNIHVYITHIHKNCLRCEEAQEKACDRAYNMSRLKPYYVAIIARMHLEHCKYMVNPKSIMFSMINSH